jgi:hypothetical protein
MGITAYYLKERLPYQKNATNSCLLCRVIAITTTTSVTIPAKAYGFCYKGSALTGGHLSCSYPVVIL